jgi:tetratricopeptide (TPR) repeat protein
VLVLPFATAVEPGTPGGTSAALWLGEALALLIADRLEAAGLDVPSRDDRVALFDRLRLPTPTGLSRPTMMRVAQMAGASEVVFGQVRLGATVGVHIDTISVAEGRVLAPIALDSSLPELLSLGASAGDRLGRALGAPLSDAPRERPEIPFVAFENYVKGLVAAMPTAAQRFLESAMTLAPHDGRVLTALWRVYADQGAHERALAAASAVPAEAPESWQARFSAALSLIELRRFDGAERALIALGAERPEAAAIPNALGLVALRRRPARNEEAAAHFQRAAAAAPGIVDYHFNLGYVRALAHDVSGALAALREAIRRNTADADAHLVMSTLYAASGKSAEAARSWTLARLLDASIESPASAPPAVVPPGLERVTSDLDRPVLRALDAAFAVDLKRAVYRAPNDHDAHLALGRAYLDAGRLSDAIDEFKVAVWCRETVTARVALGAALFDSGDREAARREAERALAIAPDSAEARALLRRIDGGFREAGVLTSSPLA